MAQEKLQLTSFYPAWKCNWIYSWVQPSSDLISSCWRWKHLVLSACSCGLRKIKEFEMRNFIFQTYYCKKVIRYPKYFLSIEHPIFLYVDNFRFLRVIGLSSKFFWKRKSRGIQIEEDLNLTFHFKRTSRKIFFDYAIRHCQADNAIQSWSIIIFFTWPRLACHPNILYIYSLQGENTLWR